MFNIFKKNKMTNYIKDVLPSPKNQTQEALYLLITNKKMTRRDFFLDTHILNAPQAIMSLRGHGVHITCKNTRVKNKFGREVVYGTYTLNNEKDAIKTYLKLVKK